MNEINIIDMDTTLEQYFMFRIKNKQKFDVLLEMINSLDFVDIFPTSKTEKEANKQKVLDNISKSLDEVELIKQQKIKALTVKELLNEC